MKYTWKLVSMKATGDSNIIYQTYWELTGTEKGKSGTFSGATPFDPDVVDPNDMTPYESLTEELVLSWIKAEVESNPTYKAHIELVIKKQIDAQNTIEVSNQDFPWLPKTESETK